MRFALYLAQGDHLITECIYDTSDREGITVVRNRLLLILFVCFFCFVFCSVCLLYRKICLVYDNFKSVRFDCFRPHTPRKSRKSLLLNNLNNSIPIVISGPYFPRIYLHLNNYDFCRI